MKQLVNNSFERQPQPNTKGNGFTLIELVIVIAIIGLLAAIAIPSYQDHVKKTRRHDAMGSLLAASAAMERYKTRNNFSYAGATLGTSGVYSDVSPIDGGTVFYNLSLSPAPTATTYTIVATPVNGQAGDGNLSINQAGQRIWAGNPDGSNNWDDN